MILLGNRHSFTSLHYLQHQKQLNAPKEKYHFPLILLKFPPLPLPLPLPSIIPTHINQSLRRHPLIRANTNPTPRHHNPRLNLLPNRILYYLLLPSFLHIELTSTRSTNFISLSLHTRCSRSRSFTINEPSGPSFAFRVRVK